MLLTTLFIGLFSYILYLIVRLIRNGVEDEKILAEYEKYHTIRPSAGVFDRILSAVFCCLALIVFGFAVALSAFEERVTETFPVYRVVLSGSMSKKHELNEHLFKNNLDDQFQQFDLVLTRPLPKEEDLQLYDIVVYEVEDTLIIHRIVGIEEPNEKHPDSRWFLLQGDNVPNKDRFPVMYKQMKAIYEGEHIPYIGSFVAFLQSPAGWICMILILVSSIAIPMMEKKIEKEKWKRLHWLLDIDELFEEKEAEAAKPTRIKKKEKLVALPVQIGARKEKVEQAIAVKVETANVSDCNGQAVHFCPYMRCVCCPYAHCTKAMCCSCANYKEQTANKE